MNRTGILAGGNWIIDRVKIIDNYPAEEALVNILDEFSSNGGAAYNLLKDLRKMQVPFPLEGIGLVGNDPGGAHILEECAKLSIKASQVRKTAEAGTSYTEVMSVQATGKRTFFHQRGANALLDETHFDFGQSRCKIFHLGYLLLLDRLDTFQDDGRTAASRVLEKALRHGFITSADLVSENGRRFRQIVPSAIPFIDYLFVNEFEAGMLSGMNLLTKAGVSVERCFDAAARIAAMGVRQWVVIHFPAGAIAVSKTGRRIHQPGVNLPDREIAGAVGAGDAFAAGVLAGIHDNRSMRKSLQLGACVAASSLLAPTSSDGVLPCSACLSMADQYGYRTNTSV